MMYEKILLGIDGSEHSYNAMLKTIELQKLYKCKVIVFHAVEHHAVSGGFSAAPSYSVPHIYSFSDPDLIRIKEVYESNAKAIIQRAEEIFSEQGLHIETRLSYDNDPVSYIKKMVNEENIDLIILGCKGTHSLLEEVFIGSTADKVLRHVLCDILVVR
jgi:nucleotide-binding universal stress UspA family protein